MHAHAYKHTLTHICASVHTHTHTHSHKAGFKKRKVNHHFLVIVSQLRHTLAKRFAIANH